MHKVRYKQVVGFPKYLVDTEGNVYSMLTMKKLKPQIEGKANKQYYKVSLRKDGITYQKKVARIVAEAFILNPENKPTVDHTNGIKFNNHYKNLRWATYKEQYASIVANGNNGNQLRGGNNGKARSVFQYTKDGKTFVAEYACIMDAGRKLCISNGATCSIVAVCKGRQKTAYGYYWSYTKVA